ncbi:TfuA-like protein [Kribbella sp. NPDC002412]
MNRYLFVGPTLPDAATIARSGVEVLPPIQSGDLFGLDLAPGDVVGIVDGYFHQRPAVRHKEILAVLAGGVRVLGAASIGALRAAELDQYGMEGVGEIYRAYRSGELEADDEVALLHGSAEDGYRPLSEPLVNLRATLNGAVDKGVLDAATRAELLARLANMPYGARTYDRVIALAEERGAALRDFLTTQGIDIKRADALKLVRLLQGEPTRRSVVRLNPTVYLDGWQLRATVSDLNDGHGPVSDLDVLRVCQLFAEDFPAFYRTWVIEQLHAECALQCHEYDVARSPLQTAIAHGTHKGLYADIHEAARNWVSPPEDVSLFLTRSYLVTPGVRDLAGLTDAVMRSPAATPARRLVRAAEHVNEQAQLTEPTYDVQQLSGPRIIDWITKHWDHPFDLSLLDRAIDSPTALETIARPFYLAARYNPDLITFRMSGF